MLDIARAIGELPPTPNDMRIVWFDGEERGLLGSSAHVRAMPEVDAKRAVAMINADMIGAPNGRPGFSLGLRTADAFGDVVRSVAQRNGLPIEQFAVRHARSDHASFDRRLIPAIDFGVDVRSVYTDDPNYHRPGDTSLNINPTVLEANADVVAATAWHFANVVAKPPTPPPTS
jgi:aminopeptidase S